jgi:hypothetical protein
MPTKFGYSVEAPNYKHQIPNNIEISISNDRNGFVSEFGHLVIGNYLEFGIWILGFQCLFGSGYTGLGLAKGKGSSLGLARRFLVERGNG